MNFAAFFPYVLLTTYTPGPNNIMSMSNARKHGFKASMRFNYGVLFGMLIVFILSAAFSSLLYEVMPKIEPVMLIIGAVYILWLAYIVWRDKPHENRRSSGQTNSFFSGVVLQFVNVKGILYAITVMSSFILPYYRSFTDIALFVLALSVICFSSTCCWSLFGAIFEKIFNKYGKILNTSMALLLVYCAASMLLEIWG